MGTKFYGLSAQLALSNCRVKTYPDGSRKILVCSSPIFNPDGVELTTSKDYHSHHMEDEPKTDTTANVDERAIRRAKQKLADYILCNDFEWFVTLTFDGSKVDRYDYSAGVRPLNTFLSNAVQRKGLKYVGVPEFHKDGAVHFHFLMNSALPLIDSGTVSVEGLKKPVKLATYKRHYKGKPCHTVYNLQGWKMGFSTAIHTYGERGRVAKYVTKYLEKDVRKVGGRYFLHSSNLRLPQVDYMTINYDEFPREPFGFPYINQQWKYQYIPPQED